MNKKFFSYLLILLALFMGALYYTNTIQSPLVSALNSIKMSYHNSVKYVQDGINKHFFQADEIADLTAKMQECKKNRLIMQQLRSDLHDIYKENNATLAIDPRTELVRTIAYEKLGNLNRLWMDVPDYNASKIYGLIYKDMVAGIIVPKENKPLALLNSDIKSTYSVYIGTQKAPGIVHGNNGEHLIVNFIPAWFDIKIGEKVTTSGLDNIFFKGLRVGVVLSIYTSQGYQNAVIKQYYNSNEPDYFHMIRKLR